MGERWKYQIKMGGFWGVLMTVFMTLSEFKEKPFLEQISSFNFYVRAAVYLITGIFIVGYFNWKGKQSQDKIDKQ